MQVCAWPCNWIVRHDHTNHHAGLCVALKLNTARHDHTNYHAGLCVALKLNTVRHDHMNHHAGLCVALKLNTVRCDWNWERSCEGLGLFKCCYIDPLLLDKEHNLVPAVTLSMESVLDTSLGLILRGMMCGAPAWLLPDAAVGMSLTDLANTKVEVGLAGGSVQHPVAVSNILVWWLLLITPCAGKAGVMLERWGWRKMAEQINWRAKQPSQKLTCQKMWSVDELERLLLYKHRVVDSTLLMTRGRERDGEKGCACQRILKGPGRVIVIQHQHWNCLRGKVGQTRFWNWETWWTTYGLSWVLKYHLELK